jgi:hypothetical protein
MLAYHQSECASDDGGRNAHIRRPIRAFDWGTRLKGAAPAVLAIDLWASAGEVLRAGARALWREGADCAVWFGLFDEAMRVLTRVRKAPWAAGAEFFLTCCDASLAPIAILSPRRPRLKLSERAKKLIPTSRF